MTGGPLFALMVERPLTDRGQSGEGREEERAGQNTQISAQDRRRDAAARRLEYQGGECRILVYSGSNERHKLFWRRKAAGVKRMIK